MGNSCGTKIAFFLGEMIITLEAEVEGRIDVSAIKSLVDEFKLQPRTSSSSFASYFMSLDLGLSGLTSSWYVFLLHKISLIALATGRANM